MLLSSSFVHNTVRLLYSRLFDLHTQEQYLAICLLVIKQIVVFSYVGLMIKPPCSYFFFFFFFFMGGRPRFFPYVPLPYGIICSFYLGYLSFTALSFT